MITDATTIVTRLIQLYWSKDNQLSLTLKHGEDEIEITGYSKEEAKELTENFFSEIQRKKLLE
jgi:hypothetical protein